MPVSNSKSSIDATKRSAPRNAVFQMSKPAGVASNPLGKKELTALYGLAADAKSHFPVIRKKSPSGPTIGDPMTKKYRL
jgi:hypothetical protein